MKYPILYEQNETDFFTLGLGPLANALSARVIEERNGSFYFEAEILTDSPIFPLVLNDCLIKADAGHLLKDQRFRIKRIVPKHNGTAEIYAEHISYLAEELTLKPEVSITGSAQVALSQWKSSIVEANPFVVDSDISTSNSTKWRIDKVENPRQALGGVGGSILDVWGGEYRFDNYHISLLQKRGTTANTVLAYGRNITDFEQENNIANTYTSIVPYAIYTDDNENEITVTVDGYTVHSQYAGNYPNTRSLPVNFSDEFDYNEVPTKAKLTQLAEQYITANEVGVPKTSIKVSFLDLSKSPDYAEYQHLEELNLCDDVRVYYPKLGVNTTAKVIRTVWNVLTESYDEIEIGEKRMTLSSKISEQTKQIKEINTQTNYAITSADGKNTIFVGLYGEDGLGEPTATKIGDSWWKPDGQFTELYIWDGTIWKSLISTKENHEIQEKIEGLETQTSEMIEDIDDAVTKAEEARLAANFATDAVDVAVTQSADAVTQAQQAKVDAITALEAYQNLEIGGRNLIIRSTETNNTWIGVTGTVVSRENHATSDFIQILPDKEYFFTKKNSELDTGDSQNGVTGYWRFAWYDENKTYIDRQPDVTNSFLWRTPNNAHFLRVSYPVDSYPKLERGNKATDWTPAPEDVQIQITNINGELSQKVSQNTFNILEGTVSTQGTQINQNKADILLRATKTDVNTLTGTVNSLDSQLKLEAGKISALNTKTDGHTTQIGSLQSSYDGLQSTVSSVRTDLDNLDIGGRNLLLNTDFSKESSSVQYWEVTGEMAIESDVRFGRVMRVSPAMLNGIRQPRTGDFLEAGEYSWSVWLKADTPTRIGVSFQGSGNNDAQNVDVTTEWKLYKGSKVISTTNRVFRIYVNDGTNSPRFYVAYPKLEKGNKATDWTPAPEDMTTVAQFSSLEQTVNGIQTTVANKAEQSEVTQLAGQISSVVSSVDEITAGNPNLLRRNNEVQGSMIWLDGQPGAHILSSRSSYPITVKSGEKLTFSQYPTNPSAENYFRYAFDNNSGTVVLREANNAVEFTVTVPSGATRLRVSYHADNMVKIERGSKKTAWAPAPEDTATQSQITQLSDQIDLRVTKSDLISQINVQAGKVLIRANDNVLMVTPTTTYIQDATIKTAHIADLAVSGAKIANASISSAKIISLDASKITATSLSAITTTTGALTVTGWLTMASQNIGLLGSYDFGDDDTGAFNPRYFVGNYRFSHRYLFFSSQVYDISNGGMGSYKYHTESFYGPDYLKLRQYTNSSKSSLSNRIDITADKLQLTNDWGTTSGVILNADGTSKFGGFAEFSNGLHVGVTSQGVGVRTGRISAPENYNTLKINENRALADVTFSTENVNFNETRTVAADFRIGKDGSSINGGRVVASMAIYNRTYSSASNMIVTPDGVLGRSTSALKYKDDVRTADDVINKAKKVLPLQPKSWLDKGELADGVANKRHYGFIADEFDALGLTEVVIYGDTGQVESLAYDRISMYHNVILREHEQRLNSMANSRLEETLLLESKLLSLEETVVQLKQEIEQLKAA